MTEHNTEQAKYVESNIWEISKDDVKQKMNISEEPIQNKHALVNAQTNIV